MNFTDRELEAYLDEALPVARMAEIETALSAEPNLGGRLQRLSARRDAGVHSLGDIWRRRRLTCPTRQQWGSYLLGVLPEGMADYYKFHVEEIGCRACAANLSDLARQQSEAAATGQQRRRRYFQSSAGLLQKK